MASSDATPLPLKNQALQITFGMWLTTGLVNTGAAGLDSEVSKDGGSFTDCTNEATEIGSSGTYTLDLTSTEMNADVVAIQTKSSTTNAITYKCTIYPSSGSKFLVVVPDTQKVDVNTIKTQAVTCAGGVTIPAATLASTTNITAATGITLANGSFVTATFGTCDFTTTMKTSLAAVPVLAQLLTFVQSDGGAGYQFTTTGLALAPTGGSAPTAIQNADALLKRDWTAISGESNYSVLQALRFLRNVWNTTDTPGTLTVMKEDGTTTAWTRPIDTDAAALPITGVE